MIQQFYCAIAEAQGGDGKEAGAGNQLLRGAELRLVWYFYSVVLKPLQTRFHSDGKFSSAGVCCCQWCF